MWVNMPCDRLEAEVQLVTPKLGGFANVRVRATLYELDDNKPNGFFEAVPAVEVEVTDQDHWISLDNTIKGTHAEAGVGGLAIVRFLSLLPGLEYLSVLKPLYGSHSKPISLDIGCRAFSRLAPGHAGEY